MTIGDLVAYFDDAADLNAPVVPISTLPRTPSN
jgi:hypothetical protein